MITKKLLITACFTLLAAQKTAHAMNQKELAEEFDQKYALFLNLAQQQHKNNVPATVIMQDDCLFCKSLYVQNLNKEQIVDQLAKLRNIPAKCVLDLPYLAHMLLLSSTCWKPQNALDSAIECQRNINGQLPQLYFYNPRPYSRYAVYEAFDFEELKK